MPGDSFCIQYTNCTGCPKNVENILVYRNLPKGEHIPKDKCTQNCMLFMIKGELLINSEEHPGITLRERQIVLQAIGSKVEILALTDVEYVVYWFNELPLLCEDRYREMMEQAEAPLTYTPLIMSERLYHLVTSMPEFLAEENPCSKYIDLKCKELVFLITNFYPLPQLSSFFYPISSVGSHVSVCPNEQTGRTVPIETRGAVAMAGTFGYELDLTQMNDEDKEAVKIQIEQYKKYADIIRQGQYYRITNPMENTEFAAWEFVSEEKDQALMFYTALNSNSNGRVHLLKFKGLDPEKIYVIEGNTRKYYGKTLMYAGIPVPMRVKEYETMTFYVKEALL